VRRGLDTNVLVYTHIPAMPDHETVRQFLHAQLYDPDITLVVTAQILHEFVHVVTDPTTLRATGGDSRGLGHCAPLS
jgi:predicted nucleic acid-binding protein